MKEMVTLYALLKFRIYTQQPKLLRGSIAPARNDEVKQLKPIILLIIEQRMIAMKIDRLMLQTSYSVAMHVYILQPK